MYGSLFCSPNVSSLLRPTGIIKPEWDEAKNRAVFGRCYNPPAHGHNYMLDVTVSGEVDPKTGMVINLFDLKRVLLSCDRRIRPQESESRHAVFRGQIPTSENLARVLWTKLDHATRHRHAPRDSAVRGRRPVRGGDGSGGLDVASVTRRYSFSGPRRQPGPGMGLLCDREEIDPVTGMVTDIGVLNRLVQERVVKMFDRQDLRTSWR